MKWLLCTFILSCSAAVAADEQPAPEQPQTSVKPLAARPQPGVVIVNGKKFYALQNAHRYAGSGLSPSALNVAHHASLYPPIVTRGTRSSLPMAPAPAAPTSAPTETGKEGTSDVLSVFAPEEKGEPTSSTK